MVQVIGLVMRPFKEQAREQSLSPSLRSGEKCLVSAPQPRLPSLQLPLTRRMAFGATGARVRLCLEIALAFQANEVNELLVLALREGIGNRRNQPLYQGDPLLQRQRLGLIHQRTYTRMVHPIGFFTGRHVAELLRGMRDYRLPAGSRDAISMARSRSASKCPTSSHTSRAPASRNSDSGVPPDSTPRKTTPA